MRAALIQMPVTADKSENLETACLRLREAKARGADIAVLPEMFCCPYDNACFRSYGETQGGEVQRALSALAAELELYVVGGSLPELEGDRVYNTSYVYGRRGELLTKHRKAHRTATFSTSTWREASASGSPTSFPREMPSPPSRRSSAPWAFASASTSGLRSWPGACASGGPGASSSPPPSI